MDNLEKQFQFLSWSQKAIGGFLTDFHLMRIYDAQNNIELSFPEDVVECEQL